MLGIVLSALIVLSTVFIAIPLVSAKGESPFVDCEEIFIDMRSFTGWTESSASFRVFTFYNDSDDANYCHEYEGNFDNDGWYTGSNVLGKGIVPVKFCNNVYSFRIPANNISHLRIVRTNSSGSEKWNLSPHMWDNKRSKYSVGGKSYSKQNAIKITGWDNSATWSTFTPTNNASYSETTAVPDSSITGNSSLYTIDATFYDYYNDDEIQNGWGNIRYATNHGTQKYSQNGNGYLENAYWEPFSYLNSKIAAHDSGVNYPLYFGNFFDKEDGFKGEGSSEMVNFSNWVNNSSRLGGTHKAIAGLTGGTLDSDGDLVYAVNGGSNSSTKVPIFDKSWLQNNKVGSVVNTKFPMRMVTSNGVKGYYFDSSSSAANGGDNVWFNSSHNTISYGAGTSNGAKDSLSYYNSDGSSSGYGFFPFDSTRGTNANALNYGFGMRVDVKFNLGADDSSHIGQIKGTNGSYVDQKFNFTGDDDVWVYVDGKLILDLGGDHQKADGSINFHDRSVSVTTGTNVLNSATRNTSFTLENYGDPTAEHTLTMFYVERGMVESNLSFNFNFAPVGNEFIVDKTVNTANVNAGIQSAVAAADTFSFNQPTANGKISSKGTISGNTYTLKDGERISFQNQFTRGQEFTVTESESSDFDYTTTWSAKDLVMNESRGSGSGKVANFTYDTSNTSEFAMTRVQLSYVNTPEVGSFTVEKKMAVGATAPAGKTFPATIYLKFKSDADARAYTLVDDDGNTHTNGKVDLLPDQPITFSGIPTGAGVYVVEGNDENYSASYSHDRNHPYIVSATSGGVTVTNTPNELTPTSAVISGTKKFDDINYTGNLFTFVLEGVPRFPVDADDAIDTSSTYLMTNTVTNGAFSFSKLNFTAPGVYRYHVYEDMSSITGATYSSDIFNNQPDYLVSITVKDVNFELVADPPVYYDYSQYEADGVTPHAMSSADFSNDKIDPMGMIFYNQTQKGSITINKTNQKNQKVNNVIFKIYQVSDDFIDGLSGMTDEQKYEAVLALDKESDIIRYATGTGPDYQGTDGVAFADGVAKFDNLPIYKNGYQTSSAPEYQKYVMIETNVSEANVPDEAYAKYNLNKTVHVFSFPLEGKYHFTYDYVNGVLKAPNTAGSGMMMFKIIGTLVAALAVLSLGGYVIYTKRSAKRKMAKHAAK